MNYLPAATLVLLELKSFFQAYGLFFNWIFRFKTAAEGDLFEEILITTTTIKAKLLGKKLFKRKKKDIRQKLCRFIIYSYTWNVAMLTVGLCNSF